MSLAGEEGAKHRKKRPERQLYVPPAQRSTHKKQPLIINHQSPIENKKFESKNEETNENENPSALPNFLICRYLLSSTCTCNVYDKGILQFDMNMRSRPVHFRDILSNVACNRPLIHLQSSPALNVMNQLIKLNENIFPLYVVQNITTNLAPKPSVINYLESNLDKHPSLFTDCDTYFIKNSSLFMNRYEDLYEHYLLWENFLKNRQDIELFLYERSKVKKSEKNNNGQIRDEDKNLKNNGQIRDEDKNLKNNNGQHRDEEIEIMLRTKENINRKTRPLMKYVEQRVDDILDIKLNDVKDWEELLDDEGEFREELLETKNSPKSDVTKETYDDVKQIEELEHMVEVYDFPNSFKTTDIIQAYSAIGSDAMYVKWVNDTRAILVLGTLTQALKAIDMENPLIKARPMSMASKATLQIAHKTDLRPAMKRPPTSLQTARRFISAHLGVKVDVSREVMTKERADLRAAREMKKMSRQNERDAWEGNLKSCIQ